MDYASYIKTNRTSLMGVAITFILLYHSYSWCIPERNPYLSIFKHGYIGVDIFIFLSGFGLCFSYAKNTLKAFYLNRLNKIFPLYIFTGLLISLISNPKGSILTTIWDVFCNISTLSYWNLGGIYWNWYIPAIVLLYLSFPIIYLFTKQFQDIFLIFTNVFISITLYFFTIPWQYECFIARIPIFILGIIIYLHQNDIEKQKRSLFISSIFFTPCLFFNISQYYTTATFCPLFLLLIYTTTLVPIIEHIFRIPCIRFIGAHTLEIFLGNSLCYYIIHILLRYTNNPILIFFSYWSGSLILSYINILLNNRINSKHYRHEYSVDK